MSSFESSTPSARRTFLERAAVGAAAFAAVPLLASCERGEEEEERQPADEPWLKPLTGKHKQVFDAPETNSGFPLIFAWAYLETMTKTYTLQPGEASAFIVTRHFGIPIALTDAIWEKYKLGAMLNLVDPATKKPSVRNFFWNSKEGDILMPDASADKLIARGVVIGVCNLALAVLSGKAAAGAGVKPEDALKEWTEGLIPGAHVVASGVLALGRAQEHGCSYCFAG